MEPTNYLDSEESISGESADTHTEHHSHEHSSSHSEHHSGEHSSSHSEHHSGEHSSSHSEHHSGEHSSSHSEHHSGEHSGSHSEYHSQEQEASFDDQEEQIGTKGRSYMQYMFHRKIPRRFWMILVPEVVISVLLRLGVYLKLVTPIYRPLHILALFGFWVLTWRLAKKNRHRTRRLRHYYFCNIAAYLLFLQVAFAAFIYAYFISPKYPLDAIYYPCFRLSLIPALLDDKHIAVEEVPKSVGMFYGVTFALILLEPIIAKISHKLTKLVRKVGKKRSALQYKSGYRRYQLKNKAAAINKKLQKKWYEWWQE